MLDVPNSDYHVSVLEVASSSASIEFLAKIEVRWKQKLLSREFGRTQTKHVPTVDA